MPRPSSTSPARGTARGRLRWLWLLAVPLLMAPECGLDVARRGVGEACTRDSECLEELVCSGGVCAEVGDAGPAQDADPTPSPTDAAPPDA
ncbi:MAG: hypothetical protein CMN29_18330 [Sandaracinus sp.]|nr:hypothetical protein [Sandaracinus sp.]